jgi:steroid delta-isomerase-like uncharacterized protein
MTTTLTNVIAARLQIVEEHLRCENEHDLPGIMATFGADAKYDDESWGEHHLGRDGVEAYYRDLLEALPDLRIEVQNRLATEESVVLEVIITGTQAGPWRGLPGTGRRVRFPLCGIFSFESTGKLAAEKIYYDRASVLRQVGLFREPTTGLGRIITGITHPLTIARAYSRQLLKRRAPGR